jgi:hypothetical protein
MEVVELKELTDKLKKFKKYKPPVSHPDLPPLYNIILSSSPKGGGKTFNCVNLLQNYSDYGFKDEFNNNLEMRIIWVSAGTSNSKANNILDTLKYLHKTDRINIEDNTNDKLSDLYDSIRSERDLINAYNVYREVFKKFKNKKLHTLTTDELMLLKRKNYIDPLEDPDVPKNQDEKPLYHPRVVFLILDDMISSDAFSNKRSGFLNKICIKSRHDSVDLVPINLFFITQSFKGINPLIRKNCDIFVLLKSASRNYIIDSVSEEIGSHFSKEEISEYYDEIMKIPYGSLILSIHKNEKDQNRVRIGWNKIVKRNPKYLSL